MSACIVASCTPCDWSETVSPSGQRVAAIRRRRSSIAPGGMSTWNSRMLVSVTISSFGSGARGLAEGEDVRLGAGAREGDGERAVVHRSTLSDELVETAVGQRAVPVFVDVDAVRVAG